MRSSDKEEKKADPNGDTLKLSPEAEAKSTPCFAVSDPVREDTDIQEHAEVSPVHSAPKLRAASGFLFPQQLPPAVSPVEEEAGDRTEESGEREELVTIIVEIGDGREESIVVYTGDKAEDLARRFAAKHGLGKNMEMRLCENIRRNIAQARSEDLVDKENLLGMPQQIVEEPNEESSGRPRALRHAATQSPENLDENVKEEHEERKSDIYSADFMGRNMSSRSFKQGSGGEQQQRAEFLEEGEATQRSAKIAPDISENLKKLAAEMSVRAIEQNPEVVASSPEFPRDRIVNDSYVEGNGKGTGSDMMQRCRRESEEEAENQKVLKAIRQPVALGFGERLYERGIKKMEERERVFKKAQQERDRQDQSFTFKPTISPISKRLAKSATKDSVRLEDRLLQAGELIRARADQKRTAEILQDKLRCPFCPSVSKK